MSEYAPTSVGPSLDLSGLDPDGLLRGDYDTLDPPVPDPARREPSPGLVALVELLEPAWHQHAVCRGVDPDLFYPGRGHSLAGPREVCAGCPVQTQCLDAGMGERFGVWAGTSERQRRGLRRERRGTAA